MKRTKKITGKLLKYAEGRIQEGKVNREKIRKYAKNMSEVSKELMHSSKLMAIHKKIFVDPSPEV